MAPALLHLLVVAEYLPEIASYKPFEPGDGDHVQLAAHLQVIPGVVQDD